MSHTVMSEDKNKTPQYYPRKMRRGWCVAHEVTAAGHDREIWNTLPDVCGSIPPGGSNESGTAGGSDESERAVGSGKHRSANRRNHRYETRHRQRERR